MRFTFLGTGTSAGIPALSCDCATCLSDDPRDNRLRTAAALRFTDATDHPRTLLLDASPDLRQQALRENITRCDAILCTHNHVDHVWGLDEVRRFNAVQKAPIDIYAEQHTLDALRRVYAHIFDAALNVNKSFVAHLIAHELHPQQPLDFFGLRITPIRLLHGRLPIVGFRIEASPSKNTPKSIRDADFLPMAYCTDVSGIPPETWPSLEGLSTLVLDCLRPRHHPTHLTVNQAVEIASQVDAKQTYFVHMAHDIKHAEVDPTLPEGMALAYDGLTLGA